MATLATSVLIEDLDRSEAAEIILLALDGPAKAGRKPG